MRIEKVEYLLWDEKAGKPIGNIGKANVTVENISQLPMIGDIITFLLPNDGPVGNFKVRSRRFTQSADGNCGEFFISEAQIILEKTYE